MLSGNAVAFTYSFGQGSAGRGLGTSSANARGTSLIADTNSIAPSQSTVFSSFANVAVNGSTLAFDAQFNGDNDTGIYSATVGVKGATLVADTSTLAPNQTTKFSAFDSPALGSGGLAFQAAYNANNDSGIYTIATGTGRLTVLADTSTAPDGKSTNFTGFSAPAVSGTLVAFGGSTSSTRGIYVGTLGRTGFNLVADTSTTAPGQSAAFSTFGRPSLDGTRLAFAASYNNNGGQGVYTAAVGRASLVRLTDTSEKAPGQIGSAAAFSGFGTPVTKDGTVAFTGNFNGSNSVGVYTVGTGGGTLTRITDTTLNPPGQRTAFSGFGPLLVSSADVAFPGYFNNGNSVGIYLYDNGTLLDVAATGETLFGSTITYVSMDADAFENGTLVFDYGLSNGVSGVASFTLVPEPATWLGGTGLLALAGLTLRRRRA